ncbi:FecR domain-containing protein [Litoribacter alkaliphilus]|uniref:FecR domain-containing protein n=1 Tax=Litoribacter ruber TaxID=702568 RepID=A0AAP2CIA9_9BACT|nr:FecR domain-containing protein [Litoribacter alkaliphilus]MBS9525226.1 FecR domain-containing protein [Litoribacter alkaliphilus]
MSEKEWEKLNSWYESQEKEELTIHDHLQRSTPKIKQNLWKGIESKIKRESRLEYLRYSGIAASVLIIFSLATLFYNPFTIEDKNLEAKNRTVANGIGMTKTVLLPDGSKATLFHNTSINFPEGFSTNRVIELNGKAFFEVEPDPSNPFQVLSEGILTEVLGTSFQVDGPKKAVSVKTGKVQVQKEGNDSLLFEVPASHWFRLVENRGEVRELENADLEFGWLEGQLHFQKASMETLTHTLQEWYGVQIYSNAEKVDCQLSGEFKKQTLEDLLIAIQYSIPLTYKIDDSHVKIQFNPC